MGELLNFYSIIFYFFFILFSSLTLYTLVDLLEEKITFKTLINILFFVIFMSLTLILLGLDFLGLIYIIVYAGAILVLFLSVLMFINLRVEELSEASDLQNIPKHTRVFNRNLKLLIIFNYVCSSSYVYLNEKKNFNYFVSDLFNDTNFHLFRLKDPVYSIGEILYTKEWFLILLIGFIFLIVMVGCVGLLLDDSKKKSPWEVLFYRDLRKKD